MQHSSVSEPISILQLFCGTFSRFEFEVRVKRLENGIEENVTVATKAWEITVTIALSLFCLRPPLQVFFLQLVKP